MFVGRFENQKSPTSIILQENSNKPITEKAALSHFEAHRLEAKRKFSDSKIIAIDMNEPPYEIFQPICIFLDNRTFLAVRCVCKSWNVNSEKFINDKFDTLVAFSNIYIDKKALFCPSLRAQENYIIDTVRKAAAIDTKIIYENLYKNLNIISDLDHLKIMYNLLKANRDIGLLTKDLLETKPLAYKLDNIYHLLPSYFTGRLCADIDQSEFLSVFNRQLNEYEKKLKGESDCSLDFLDLLKLIDNISTELLEQKCELLLTHNDFDKNIIVTEALAKKKYLYYYLEHWIRIFFEKKIMPMEDLECAHQCMEELFERVPLLTREETSNLKDIPYVERFLSLLTREEISNLKDIPFVERFSLYANEISQAMYDLRKKLYHRYLEAGKIKKLLEYIENQKFYEKPFYKEDEDPIFKFESPSLKYKFFFHGEIVEWLAKHGKVDTFFVLYQTISNRQFLILLDKCLENQNFRPKDLPKIVSYLVKIAPANEYEKMIDKRICMKLLETMLYADDIRFLTPIKQIIEREKRIVIYFDSETQELMDKTDHGVENMDLDVSGQ